MTTPLLVIEPNLRSPSGHYADFVRALGDAAGGGIQVYADPAADPMLSGMHGVELLRDEPRVGSFLAEWRTIVRCVSERRPFLLLTADGRHAAVVSLASRIGNVPPDRAMLFFHRPPTTLRDSFLIPLAGRAKRSSLAVTATLPVAEHLRKSGWRHVELVPYPVNAPPAPSSPVPFRHLLMAGAARVNKGLDLVVDLVGKWKEAGIDLPLLIQVSPKKVERHGSREQELVRTLLTTGYGGLRADQSAPDRNEYLARFRGALVLAPYAREQFASQVSGVVLDALLSGAPVVATEGTWPGEMVKRFDAGLTIAERSADALDAAIHAVLADWERYARNALAAARALEREHDPRHLLQVISRWIG